MLFKLQARPRVGLVALILLAGAAPALLDAGWGGPVFAAGMALAAVVAICAVGDPALRTLLLGALALRCALSLVQAYSGIDLPGAGKDSVTFDRYGWENAQLWLAGGRGFAARGGEMSYAALLGAFYYLFGRVVLVPQVFNALVGTGVVYLTALVAWGLSGKRRAALAGALIAALHPTLASFSAITLREIILIFFVICSFYLFLRWLQGHGYLQAAGAVAVTVAMAFFHGAMLLVNWIFFPFFAAVRPGEQRLAFSWRQAALFLLVVLLLVSFLALDLIPYYGPLIMARFMSVESFQNLLDRTPGRTHYLEGMLPHSLFDIAWQTPVRVFYFLFTPFPWMIGGAGDLFVFAEVLLYILLCCYAVAGLLVLWRAGRQRAAALALAAVTLSIVVIFAWGTVNFGSAWRHRAKAAPLLIGAAAVGLAASPRLLRFYPDEPGAGEA